MKFRKEVSDLLTNVKKKKPSFKTRAFQKTCKKGWNGSETGDRSSIDHDVVCCATQVNVGANSGGLGPIRIKSQMRLRSDLGFD